MKTINEPGIFKSAVRATRAAAAIAAVALSALCGHTGAATFMQERLANGTQVFIAHTPGHQRTLFRLGSTVGPADVGCDRLQLPHLTEHLMFEGFGPDGQETLTRIFDRYAGRINAMTTPNAVTVHGYVHSQFSGDAIRLLGEAITYRESIAHMLERERKIIMSELGYGGINGHIGHALSAPYTLLSRRMPGTCGRDRSIMTLTADDVAAFWLDLFDPRNLTLYVSSDLPPETLLPAIREALGKRQQTGVEFPLLVRPPISASGLLNVLRWSAGDDVDIGALLYVDPANTNLMAQELLLALLHAEAREAVRRKGGHAYALRVDYRPEYGAILVSTTPRPGEHEPAMAALMDAVRRVLSGDLPDAWFAEQRRAYALRTSAYATSPEINLDIATWRPAALVAGVDVTDTRALERMSKQEFADFTAAWVVGAPIHFVERRPMSYVPWWALAGLMALVLIVTIPWQRVSRAISSISNR